eukprot:TRINITY_DN666_c0_g1_i1.p1 TRINITY_DN666_c0_g1~~TRINITY_DN666_c0_g1_i1.p1  ORF type:complete len:1355 (+),score=538.10 TRINITY_DN666_c0_g1_i1:88-4152(+)
MDRTTDTLELDDFSDEDVHPESRGAEHHHMEDFETESQISITEDLLAQLSEEEEDLEEHKGVPLRGRARHHIESMDPVEVAMLSLQKKESDSRGPESTFHLSGSTKATIDVSDDGIHSSVSPEQSALDMSTSPRQNVKQHKLDMLQLYSSSKTGGASGRGVEDAGEHAGRRDLGKDTRRDDLAKERAPTKKIEMGWEDAPVVPPSVEEEQSPPQSSLHRVDGMMEEEEEGRNARLDKVLAALHGGNGLDRQRDVEMEVEPEIEHEEPPPVVKAWEEFSPDRMDEAIKSAAEMSRSYHTYTWEDRKRDRHPRHDDAIRRPIHARGQEKYTDGAHDDDDIIVVDEDVEDLADLDDSVGKTARHHEAVRRIIHAGKGSGVGAKNAEMVDERRKRSGARFHDDTKRGRGYMAEDVPIEEETPPPRRTRLGRSRGRKSPIDEDTQSIYSSPDAYMHQSVHADEEPHGIDDETMSEMDPDSDLLFGRLRHRDRKKEKQALRQYEAAMRMSGMSRHGGAAPPMPPYMYPPFFAPFPYSMFPPPQHGLDMYSRQDGRRGFQEEGRKDDRDRKKRKEERKRQQTQSKRVVTSQEPPGFEGSSRQRRLGMKSQHDVADREKDWDGKDDDEMDVGLISPGDDDDDDDGQERIDRENEDDEGRNESRDGSGGSRLLQRDQLSVRSVAPKSQTFGVSGGDDGGNGGAGSPFRREKLQWDEERQELIEKISILERELQKAKDEHGMHDVVNADNIQMKKQLIVLREELEEKKKQCDTLQEVTMDMTNSIKETEQEVRKKKEELASLSTQMNALKSENDHLKETLDRFRDDLQDAAAKKNQTDLELKDVNAKMKQDQTMLRQFILENESLKKENAQARKTILQVEKENELQQSCIRELKAQIQEISSSSAEAASMEDSLKRDIEEEREQVKELQMDISELNATIQDLRQQLRASAKEKSELEKQMLQLHTQLNAQSPDFAHRRKSPFDHGRHRSPSPRRNQSSITFSDAVGAHDIIERGGFPAPAPAPAPHAKTYQTSSRHTLDGDGFIPSKDDIAFFEKMLRHFREQQGIAVPSGDRAGTRVGSFEESSSSSSDRHDEAKSSRRVLLDDLREAAKTAKKRSGKPSLRVEVGDEEMGPSRASRPTDSMSFIMSDGVAGELSSSSYRTEKKESFGPHRSVEVPENVAHQRYLQQTRGTLSLGSVAAGKGMEEVGEEDVDVDDHDHHLHVHVDALSKGVSDHPRSEDYSSSVSSSSFHRGSDVHDAGSKSTGKDDESVETKLHYAHDERPFATDMSMKESFNTTSSIEAELMNLNQRREALEMEQQKLESHGAKTIASRRRLRDIEEELDDVNRSISSLRMRLRSLDLLHQ